MSKPVPVQLLAAALFVAVLVVAAILIADDWSDYIVFGVFGLALLGTAIAVNKRQYPTKKRGFTRESDERW